MLSITEKDYIFSIIKENFCWISKDCNRHISYMFEEDIEGFNLNWGAVKYCISGEVFPNYVVKFCLDDFDYCEREYTNYLAAVEAHLEKYFPYTDYLGEINGISYFIQEKAEVDVDCISDIFYKEISDGWEWEWEEEKDSEEIWNYIEDLDDYDRINILFGDDALLEFIDVFHINDLHEGNYGYINGRLVIIDFSGYGAIARLRDF